MTHATGTRGSRTVLCERSRWLPIRRAGGGGPVTATPAVCVVAEDLDRESCRLEKL